MIIFWFVSVTINWSRKLLLETFPNGDEKKRQICNESMSICRYSFWVLIYFLLTSMYVLVSLWHRLLTGWWIDDFWKVLIIRNPSNITEYFKILWLIEKYFENHSKFFLWSGSLNELCFVQIFLCSIAIAFLVSVRTLTHHVQPLFGSRFAKACRLQTDVFEKFEFQRWRHWSCPRCRGCFM